MIFTRHGNCGNCKVRMTRKAEILPQVTLFDPIPGENAITPDMRPALIDFRGRPLLCDNCSLTHEVCEIKEGISV